MSTGEHRRLHTTLLAGLRVFTPTLLCSGTRARRTIISSAADVDGASGGPDGAILGGHAHRLPDFDRPSSVVGAGRGRGPRGRGSGETDGVAGGSDITGFVGGAANLTMCPTGSSTSTTAGDDFECPSDNAELPSQTAWTTRSAAFGKAVVGPPAAALPLCQRRFGAG